MSGIFPPTTEPLGERVQEHQARKGGNIHAISKELEAQDSDVDSLPAGMRDAKEELKKANALQERAEAKLLTQLQHQTTHKNQIDAIQVLRGEIGLAEAALTEFQFTIKNSVAAHENWPFLMRQSSGGRYGQWAHSFCADITTAREMLLLLPGWIESAKKRLATMEKEAAAFKEKHKLE
jgi:hypothetical protein